MPGIIIDRQARSIENKGRIIDLMSLDPTWLFLSMIPGGIGFVLFVYGKKQGRWVMAISGLIFMIYPYFTQSIAALVGVGVVLSVATWIAINAGW